MPILDEDLEKITNAVSSAGEKTVAKVKEITDASEAKNKEAIDAAIENAKKTADAKSIHDGTIEVNEKEPDFLTNTGKFLVKVHQAAISPSHQETLEKALAIHHKGQNTQVSSEGGFLPTAQIGAELRDKAYETGQLLADSDVMPIGGTNDRFVWNESDVDSRAAAGYNGVVAYRTEEATAVAESLATLREREIAVKDMMVYITATNQILQDSVALGAYVMKNAPKAMNKKIDNEIMRGTGAGQCLGILNSPSLISIAKETNQVADTIIKENIEKMYDSLDPELLSGAKFYINAHARKEIRSLTVAVGTGGSAIMLPEGVMAGAPFGSLMGIPIQPTNACSKLGDLGDIVLANLDEYQMVEKGGVEAFESMHFLFDVNKKAFRWTWRINGAPKWANSVTPEHGNTGDKLSYAVALADRA